LFVFVGTILQRALPCVETGRSTDVGRGDWERENKPSFPYPVFTTMQERRGILFKPLSPST